MRGPTAFARKAYDDQRQHRQNQQHGKEYAGRDCHGAGGTAYDAAASFRGALHRCRGKPARPLITLKENQRAQRNHREDHSLGQSHGQIAALARSVDFQSEHANAAAKK